MIQRANTLVCVPGAASLSFCTNSRAPHMLLTGHLHLLRKKEKESSSWGPDSSEYVPLLRALQEIGGACHTDVYPCHRHSGLGARAVWFVSHHSSKYYFKYSFLCVGGIPGGLRTASLLRASRAMKLIVSRQQTRGQKLS